MRRLLILVPLIALAGCKKDYTCECKNSNSTYTAGTVEATKKKAKQHCESLSTSNTECYVK